MVERVVLLFCFIFRKIINLSNNFYEQYALSVSDILKPVRM